jgi:hypothetical protein
MSTIVTRASKGSPLTNTEIDSNFSNLNTDKQEISAKDASGGYAGLTLFKLNLKNAANTVTSWFTTAATAARTWTMPDKDGTVAMLSDITGTNSGTNTGDQAIGGSSGALQYNNAGAFGGASNASVQDGDMLLGAASSLIKPSTGVKLFGKAMAGRTFPAMIDAGSSAPLQPALFRNKISIWESAGVATPPATSVGFISGFQAPTIVGTATLRTFASTNLLTRAGKTGYVSAATAGSLASLRMPIAAITTTDGAGLGGFFTTMRIAITDAAAVAGARSFFGLSSNIAAATNVEPNTLLNSVGLAQLSTDSTQLYLVYGGTTAQTAIALGTNFPPMAGVGINNGILYDISINTLGLGASVIGWRVERVGTAFVAEGVLTPTTVGVNTPAASVFLTQQIWRTNNATALAVAFDLSLIYAEVEN